MLVITRKSHQRVMIGKDITIEVLEIRNSGVKLGVSAPRDVSIHREEVALRIEDPPAVFECAACA